MARTVRNAKIDSRSARAKLPRRREPHWTMLAESCALGYRKGITGGTWIARFRAKSGRQHYEAIGRSDDLITADDQLVFSFANAQEKAQLFFKKMRDAAVDGTGLLLKPVTVSEVLDAYFAAYVRRGGKAINRMRSSARTHIEPRLGQLSVHKLNRGLLEQWHSDIAKSVPAVRGKMGQPSKSRRGILTLDKRKRSATANRVLTILKAALNHARSEGYIGTDAAWDSVRAFREVDVARHRYLSDEDSRKLIEACAPHFRKLVVAALVSGCRYGELCALTCADYNQDSDTILVRVSKSSKSRHVAVAKKGSEFFKNEIKGKSSNEYIFTRQNGGPWSSSDQQRPMQEAVKLAGLEPITFHGLRHTYASRLAMKAVPLIVIAKQLGHSDTRMVEKHYGHLAPNYIADQITAAFGDLDFEGSTRDRIPSAA